MWGLPRVRARDDVTNGGCSGRTTAVLVERGICHVGICAGGILWSGISQGGTDAALFRKDER